MVLGKLARGGMAEVWLARQRGPAGFQKTLVLKSIAAPFNEDPAFVQMFLAEARLAALINHPNVVQIFDLEDAPGAQFIAMEFLEGRNLYQVTKALAARAMPFDASVAVRVMTEACAGLEFAHALKDNRGAELKIIHRDVTPENIFVTYQGHIKVLDFGIAKAAQGVNTTKPGNVRGKLMYLAPEQVLGHALDRRVDIWSVGVNLYVLLTGKFPFEGPNELEHMRAILQHAPLPPSKVRQDLPPALDAIVMRALEKEPAKRYATAGALRLALEEFLRDQPPVSAFHVASLMELLFPANTDPIRQKLDALLSLPTEEIVKNLSGETAVESLRANATPARPLAGPSAAALPPPEVMELNTAQFAAALDGSFRDPIPTDPLRSLEAEDKTNPGAPPSFGDQTTAPGEPRAQRAGGYPPRGGQGDATVVAPPPARAFEATVVVRLPPEGERGVDDPDVTAEDTLPHAPQGAPPVVRAVRSDAAAAQKKKRMVQAAGAAGLVLLVGLAFSARSTPDVTAPPVVEVTVPPVVDVTAPRVAAQPDVVDPPRAQPDPAVPATAQDAPEPDVEPPPDDTPEEKLPEPRRGTPSGALAISSNVRANVYVDGRMVGRTPLRLGHVSVGEHRVRVVFRASEGAVSKELTAPVKNGLLTERRVTFGKGRLNVRVSPWAEVRVDGRRFGLTPMAPITLMEGEHELQLDNKDLKARKVMRITVEAGKDTEVKVKLGD